VVSNPMSSMERTHCSTCNAMFPITEFVWADTDERISDYYSRHTRNATALQRFLCSKKFMVLLIISCMVFTEVSLYFLLANANRMALTICLLIGLVIGAFIGMAIFISGFADPIKRKVCGVPDTRMLT
jgi:hypothetical protein